MKKLVVKVDAAEVDVKSIRDYNHYSVWLVNEIKAILELDLFDDPDNFVYYASRQFMRQGDRSSNFVDIITDEPRFKKALSNIKKLYNKAVKIKNELKNLSDEIKRQ